MSKGNDELDPRPAASGSGSSAVPAVGRRAGTAQAQGTEPWIEQGTEPGTHRPAAEVRRSRRAADAPVDAEPAAPERISLARARDRQALRTYRALAKHSLPSDATSYDAMPTRRQLRLPAALEGSRRDRRRRMGPEEAAVEGDGTAVDDLSVEQALAAREAIIGQAVEQVAMIEGRTAHDPFAVDLEILAQQKALAERAAVLNSRAQKIQQLSEENSQRRPQPSDPTTAHNLSIVAQPEYVNVPGVDRPVLKAPTTSHIPVIPRPAAGVPGGPAARRSQVLAQAETIARNHGRPTEDGATPVRARSAHGLDPLDAMTAGLARVRRMRYLQFSILGLGVLALLTGILMIVSGFGS